MDIIQILERLGFRLENEKINEYDVLCAYYDIEGKPEDFKAIIVNVNTDSGDVLREIVMAWSKYKADANKIVLIVENLDLIGEVREIAERNDIILLTKKDIKEYSNYFDEDKESAAKKFLSLMNLATYIDPEMDYVPESNEG